MKEFMALRNLVHFYCPDPFKTQLSEKQEIENQESKIEESKFFSAHNFTVNGPFMNQKDSFMQVRPK